MSYAPFIRLCRGFVAKGVVSPVVARNMSLVQERKQKILVTRKVPQAAIEILKSSQSCDIDHWDSDDPIPRSELLKRVSGADGLYCLLTEKIDAELLQAAGPQLKVVSTMSVGFDHVSLPETSKRGIAVGHTPGVLTDATATLTVGLLLATQRRLIEAAAEVKNGGWGTWKPRWMCGPTLMGSTVGIVGFGRIGIAVAQRLAPCGVARFLYADVNKKSENEEGMVTPKAEHVNMDTLFKESDFVTTHTALTPQTAGMFNNNAFSKMKRNAVFVNTSRGGVVNQEDLYEALKNGEIWGAGLDVTVPEPLPLDHPLLTLRNCVVLPHIGSAEESTREAMAVLAAKNLLAGLAGESLPAQAKL
ncbi:glyoxylate reductase/hydroxypyruvate reductase-like [Montipora capricornis]|uniref:glyoxylate reductase/hydroxypyruvate reductase-like n=1 Tax=Montipora capricornis TaxID=246305 RepID=UPI0035F10D36